MNSEIVLLMNAIAESTPGFTFRVLKVLAEADWQWFPGGLSRAGFADMFNNHREKAWKEGGVFRAGANEILLAYPFMRDFVAEHVPSRKIPLERQSFLCLCTLTGLINETKHHSTPVAMRQRMRDAVGRFLTAHKAAYDVDSMVPKHHFQCHVVSDQEDDIFLDCFVHERQTRL